MHWMIEMEVGGSYTPAAERLFWLISVSYHQRYERVLKRVDCLLGKVIDILKFCFILIGWMVR